MRNNFGPHLNDIAMTSVFTGTIAFLAFLSDIIRLLRLLCRKKLKMPDFEEGVQMNTLTPSPSTTTDSLTYRGPPVYY